MQSDVSAADDDIPFSSSPVDQVPVEILIAIFTFAHSNASVIGMEFDIPNVISSVNSRWRNIALNLPFLWSSINISANFPLEYSLSHATQRFSRSQTYPLTILIDFEEFVNAGDTAVSPDLEMMQKICAHFTPHADRIMAITVKVSDKDLLGPFEGFLEDKPPAQFKRSVVLLSKDIIARRWRHELQRSFLTRSRVVTTDDMPRLNSILKEVEESRFRMTSRVLSYSKIDKVLRHIADKNPEEIPLNDELHFQRRIDGLVEDFKTTREAGRRSELATITAALTM